ncbi:hypothetical protein [Actinoplanes sp. NPDC051859]|uniref:hypothetical protein n=1 Tax=Actinoplanes sp. NPDC051859 TaxID=3363909 RepID=UPI0037A4FE9F
MARRFTADLSACTGLALLALSAVAPSPPAAPDFRQTAAAALDPVPLTGEPGMLIAASGNIACGHTAPAFKDGKGTAVGCAMGRTSDYVWNLDEHPGVLALAAVNLLALGAGGFLLWRRRSARKLLPGADGSGEPPTGEPGPHGPGPDDAGPDDDHPAGTTGGYGRTPAAW